MLLNLSASEAIGNFAEPEPDEVLVPFATFTRFFSEPTALIISVLFPNTSEKLPEDSSFNARIPLTSPYRFSLLTLGFSLIYWLIFSILPSLLLFLTTLVKVDSCAPALLYIVILKLGICICCLSCIKA